MGAFLATFRQSFRRTDTTRTGAESLAATDAGPEAADSLPSVDARRSGDVSTAEAAAYTEDADRTADQLMASVHREMTLANTPLWFQHPDAGYGDDDFAEDHSGEAVDLLEEHLRSHPDLRSMSKWAGDYAALDADDADAAALGTDADEAQAEPARQVPPDQTGDVDEL
jgi:hypothetical protein